MPFLEKDETEKNKKIDNIFNRVLPNFLKIAEARLTGGQFICGDKLTTADF